MCPDFVVIELFMTYLCVAGHFFVLRNGSARWLAVTIRAMVEEGVVCRALGSLGGLGSEPGLG